MARRLRALIPDKEETDYILHPKHTGCWVTVGTLSIHIVKTDEGAVVDIFGKGKEFDPPTASTYAFFNEVLSEEELDALPKL